MSESIIRAILDWNPWLEGAFPQELLGVKRDYNLLPLLQVPEIKILEGARRAGKSTLFYQLIHQLLNQGQQVLYLNFEDDELAKHSLSDIYYAYLKHAKFDHLFLDEVQHCQQWVPFLRKIYDTKQINQLWLGGSNSALIKEGYKKLLTGRNLLLEINPLSFQEFLQFKGMEHASLPLSSAKEVEVLKLFDVYLTLGAFPAVTLRTVLHKELLINYFDDILYKDIITRYNVNPEKIKQLAVYLATNCAKNFSYRRVGNALNIHPATVTDYMGYFKEVFLFSELRKFDYAIKNQLTTDKKVYCIDGGLAAANAFRFSEDKGRMLETMVYNSLRRQKEEIYFHKQAKECDFVVKTDLEVTAIIQVCYSLQDDSTREREYAGLMEAMNYFKLDQGLVLTMNEAGEHVIKENGTSYRIVVMPIWKWLLENERAAM